MTGIELIAKERQKQIEKHGFTGEHHANHPKWYGHGQLTYAARLLCDECSQNHFDFPPVNWDRGWWVRLCQKPYEERLIISGALIAAEIDRLKNLELYVVTAYRWGDRKDHSYVLGVFTKKQKAIDCADSHTKYRGGKYACVVDECVANVFDNDADDYAKEIYRAKSIAE